MKKISVFVICLLLVMASFNTVLAGSDENEVGTIDNPVKIEKKDIDITKTEKQEYKKITEKVAESILDGDSNCAEKSIQNVVKKSDYREGIDIVEGKIADAVKENSNLAKPNIVLEENLTMNC